MRLIMGDLKVGDVVVDVDFETDERVREPAAGGARTTTVSSSTAAIGTQHMCCSRTYMLPRPNLFLPGGALSCR